MATGEQAGGTGQSRSAVPRVPSPGYAERFAQKIEDFRNEPFPREREEAELQAVVAMRLEQGEAAADPRERAMLLQQAAFLAASF